MSSSSQDTHLAELNTGPLSTYTQVTGGANNGVPVGTLGYGGLPIQSAIPGVSTYIQGGYVHSVNIISAGSGATPPTLIVDGWTNTDKIVAAIPGNQAVGNVQINAPVEKALRVLPSPGAAVAVNFSVSPFKN